MYYLIVLWLNIFMNLKIFVFYCENNIFIFLLFKKKYVNKLILFNGLIIVFDCFFFLFNKIYN